ncbi:MAG TPA: hypothetical protein VM370_03085 [Candidatus Thermoplasmatota archaeon]|nr:hypothetical protein [Candidatus Thermoplasmatota archaeon]
MRRAFRRSRSRVGALIELLHRGELSERSFDRAWRFAAECPVPWSATIVRIVASIRSRVGLVTSRIVRGMETYSLTPWGLVVARMLEAELQAPRPLQLALRVP